MGGSHFLSQKPGHKKKLSSTMHAYISKKISQLLRASIYNYKFFLQCRLYIKTTHACEAYLYALHNLHLKCTPIYDTKLRAYAARLYAQNRFWCVQCAAIYITYFSAHSARIYTQNILLSRRTRINITKFVCGYMLKSFVTPTAYIYKHYKEVRAYMFRTFFGPVMCTYIRYVFSCR